MRRGVGYVIIGGAIVVLMACAGIELPFDLIAMLLIGWCLYLFHVVPHVHVSAAGVFTAVACLVCVTAGVHGFLSWLCEEAFWPKKMGEQVAHHWRWRWTGWLVGGVVLMFVAGIATVGIAHQVGWLLTAKAITTGGGPSRRAQSANNLKQIGLALDNYVQRYASFPPAATFDGHGRPLHGWQAAILPFVEQPSVHDQIDFQVPWTDARNAPAYQTQIPLYLFPGVEQTTNKAGYALSHYSGNVAMLGGDQARTINDVTDSTEFTILAGEVVSQFKPWGDPTNWRDPALGVNRSPSGFGSRSPGGANFLMVDGSVRFVKNTVDPGILKALSTPAGSEKISWDQY
jgi:prepilin-type processing-associated H-X9-DG protein